MFSSSQGSSLADGNENLVRDGAMLYAVALSI